MSKRKINSRALRQLAEEVIERLGDEFRLSGQADLITSLVRQWITYDGHASFFLGDSQVYLNLGRTPLGKQVVHRESISSGWIKVLTQDWKIDPADLPDILEQLNVGQSAETLNGDSLPLRLYVNPKERSQGVQPLVKQKVPPVVVRDHRKIASDILIEKFGNKLGPEETDKLIGSVVSQWQRFDGHASIFFDGRTEFHLKIAERDGGRCEVVARKIGIDLEPVLSSYGFPPDVFPEVIAQINLGEQIEFRDRKGVRTRMWHDPKNRRFCHVSLDAVSQPGYPPFLCPKCTAVLLPWPKGERQQSCPICGHIVPIA